MSHPEDETGYSGSLEDWATDWPGLLNIKIVIPSSSSPANDQALVLPVLSLTASPDVLPGYTTILPGGYTTPEEFDLPI